MNLNVEPNRIKMIKLKKCLFHVGWDFIASSYATWEPEHRQPAIRLRRQFINIRARIIFISLIFHLNEFSDGEKKNKNEKRKTIIIFPLTSCSNFER